MKHQGIYQRGGRGNYYAKVRHWDNSLKRWRWRAISTETSDPIKALATRDELQALADTAHRAGDSTITHQKAAEMAARVLSWHGIASEGNRDLSWPPWPKYAANWLQMMKPGLSTGSFTHYSGHVERVNEWLADPETALDLDSPLGEWRRTHVLEFHAWLRQQGRTASTAYNIARTLRTIFAAAVDDEILARNPAGKLPEINQGQKRRNDPFTADDVAALIEYLRQPGCPNPCAAEWVTACFFGLTLGCRLGDATLRDWQEIHWETITDATGGSIAWIEYLPEKTRRHGKPVRAPITDPLLSHLQRISGEGSPADLRGPITPTLATTPRIKSQGLTQQFSEIMAEARLTWRTEEKSGAAGRNWRSKGFHSFRHTLPTLMAAADVPAEIRKAIVGHTQDATHHRYIHHDDAQLRQALENSLASLAFRLDP